ncbi:uncharacterized protein [Eurosta solidaginis]|uniref:uncharacterized protein n=1 Tax=Eurosta solidaginis TaxID=178769 RepID=UPI003530B92B
MGTRYREKLSVEDICAVLEEFNNNEEDEVKAIYIEAPDAGALSGEDSSDEDGGSLENLPHTQLVEESEVVIRKKTDVEENPDFNIDTEILDYLNHSLSDLEVNLLEESFSSEKAPEKPSTSLSAQKPIIVVARQLQRNHIVRRREPSHPFHGSTITPNIEFQFFLTVITVTAPT